MSYVKVDDNPNLVRDNNSGAVLNINRNEIKEEKKRRNLARIKSQEQQQLKDDVNSLKKDMQEIKTILGKLAERL